MITALVHSSNGDIKMHPATGVVIECEEFEDCEGELSNIFSFDLDEYFATYKDEVRGEVLHFDILDLGYHFTTPTGAVDYCEPAHDWRKECGTLSGYHDGEEQGEE